MYHSEFKWNHRKNTRSIIYPVSTLPVMLFNNGFKTFDSFCTQMERLRPDLIKAAFIADNIRVKSMSDDENINLPEYLAGLSQIISRYNLSKDKELCMQEHYRLNYPSHSTIQTLAKN